MLFLGDVHFVTSSGCVPAMVEGFDVDVAHVAVYVDRSRSMPPDPFCWIEVCCVEYDAKGSLWTLHTEADCPKRIKLPIP